ncbi:MAG: hemolysin family protein, partial [Gemmatimonadaceae bacterium]
MVPPIRRFDRLLSLDYYIDYTHMVLGLVAAEAADPPSMAVAASSMVAVLGLVLVNGFFVAAEFSLVAARRSKLDEMIAKGDRAARTVQTALQNLDRYIAATQLGITIASLALGWVGEPVLAQLFDQAFRTLGVNPSPTTTHVAAVPVAFFLLTFFHIVLGELAPKSIALASPERTARAVTRPLMVFSRFMSPFIWLFNGAANALLRIFGVDPASDQEGHSPEEIRFLVMQAHARGTLDESDRAMLAGVLDFHEK